MADCVYRLRVLEVFLGPFSNVHDRIMPMSDAVSYERLKTMGIQQSYSALFLTHRHFSSFFESFDDLMTVDDEICKALQFAIDIYQLYCNAEWPQSMLKY